METNKTTWDYRVIGININRTTPSSSSKAAEKLGKTFTPDFLEKEFPQEYVANRSTNTALQCQQVIQIYGKYGWEHYQQGQLGDMAMLYFKKNRSEDNNYQPEISASEKTILNRLDPLQRP